MTDLLPVQRFLVMFAAMGVLSRQVFAGCAAVAILVALAPLAVAQDQVTVVGDVREGRGMLIFDWPRPVAFSTDVADRRLTIRFARPFDAYFGQAVMALGSYLDAGGLYPDRRTAVFALKRDVTVQGRNDGNRVVIELIDPAPPPPAKPTAKPATHAAAAPATKAKPQSPLDLALASLGEGNPDAALAAIENSSGVAFDRLRQDIFWRQRDWSRAAPVALRLAERLAVPERLSEDGARQVLNAAVAATLAGDMAGLARLRARFASAMERTDFRDAFRLIAGGQGAIENVGQSARALEIAEGFRRFLAQANPTVGPK